MNIESLDPKAFAPTTREDWLKLVNRALKGADFQETLVSHTDDGIAIEPLYGRRPDAQPLPNSRGAAPWTIAQRMDDPDTRRALAQLGDDLANGATGICLVSKTSPSAFGTGIDTDGFAHKLAGAISGKAISLRLDGCSPHFVETFVAALDEPSKPSALHLGLSAFAGKPDDLADAFLRLQGAGFAGTILNADGRAVHSAGGTEAQELAVMAATLAGHLRMMERAGVAPDRVLDATSLCLAADQNQFVTMAKARAARLIFTRIAEVCGISNAPAAHLFMETSYRMLTKLDPETNILRNTVAVFAAGTGGADEISVLPHTLTHGIPDPLARRLARNTQTILLAESHLDHVTDPAAGAGG
ncbi:MAG: methylmalonyl-CoA mutase, partial [Rhizobiaceae bacterium]|nr:methylmalonyl-CoA mutase [Rhizobiaceae bacterium]